MPRNYIAIIVRSWHLYFMANEAGFYWDWRADTSPAADVMRALEQQMAHLIRPEEREKYLAGTWLFPPPDDHGAHLEAFVGYQETLVSAVSCAWEKAVTPVVAQLVKLVDDRYPHVCPRCSGPAYVGAVEVDCAGGCR